MSNAHLKYTPPETPRMTRDEFVRIYVSSCNALLRHDAPPLSEAEIDRMYERHLMRSST